MATNRTADWVDGTSKTAARVSGTANISDDSAEAKKYVRALSAVLRLGRKGASTDHSSVLFDCDISEPGSDSKNSKSKKAGHTLGALQKGTTNGHWYQLGLRKGLATCWLPPPTSEEHPDAPGLKVTGKVVPSIEEAINIVVW
jgi:hypothetical protein